MNQSHKTYIQNLLYDIISFEEDPQLQNDPQLQARKEHAFNNIIQYLDVLSDLGYDYNEIMNWTNDQYDKIKSQIKLHTAKKKLALFRLQKNVRFEPGIFEMISKYHATMPTNFDTFDRDPISNRDPISDSSNISFDLNESDLDVSDLDEMVGGRKKSKRKKHNRKTKKKQIGGASHLGPSNSINYLLDNFANYWWHNAEKIVWWSDGQEGYFFSNLKNNYMSQTHVHIYGTSNQNYPTYFYMSTKINDIRYNYKAIYMHDFNDAYYKITELCHQLFNESY